jgi:hypothetical protein
MTFKKIICNESSAVEEVSYDEDTQIMRIKYQKANQYYDFSSVISEDIQTIQSAESVGRAVHKVVKDKSFVKSDFQ